ncbi:MAG: TraR/DksA family transcriptional regulator [Neptuniibacter sp.]
MSKFVDEMQLDKLLEHLKDLKSELGREAKTLNPSSQPEAVSSKSEGDPVQHSDQRVLFPLSNLDSQERLRQVEEALDKIDMDFYGYCESCGKPITEKRSELHTNSQLCSQCNPE